MNPNLVQRRTVGTPGEITIAPVTSETGAGEKSTQPKSAPVNAAIAIRRGPIDENGAHFATPGNSTYFDEDAVGHGAEKYDLSSANIADTSDPKTILHEAAKDERLTPEEHERIDRQIADAEKSEPYISYLENEELPLPDAAKRLGYDGIKVWENDDVGNPSSVFLWNTDKAKTLKIRPAPGEFPNEIKMVAEEVRSQLLGDKAAEWKDCTPVSYALADKLKGEYQDVAVASGDYGTTQHNWVVVPSKNLYIDATHDQFGNNAIRPGHLTDEDYRRDYSPDPQDIWVKANSAEFPEMLNTALAESESSTPPAKGGEAPAGKPAPSAKSPAVTSAKGAGEESTQPSSAAAGVTHEYVHFTRLESVGQILRGGFDLTKYGSGIGPKREVNIVGVSLTRDADVSRAYQKAGLHGIAVKVNPKKTLDLSKIDIPTDKIIRSGAYGTEQESREGLAQFLENRGRPDLADKVDAGESVHIPGDIDPDNAVLMALGFPVGADISREQLTAAAIRAGYDSISYRDEFLALDPKIIKTTLHPY